jgi:hypothetical protein
MGALWYEPELCLSATRPTNKPSKDMRCIDAVVEDLEREHTTKRQTD